MNIHNLMISNIHIKNNFLISLLKDNYGPLCMIFLLQAKIFFIYKLNKNFLISLDMYSLLINLKNTNYVDSLIIIKTVKHCENFFDGTKYVIKNLIDNTIY